MFNLAMQRTKSVEEKLAVNIGFRSIVVVIPVLPAATAGGCVGG